MFIENAQILVFKKREKRENTLFPLFLNNFYKKEKKRKREKDTFILGHSYLKLIGKNSPKYNLLQINQINDDKMELGEKIHLTNGGSL